MQKLAAWMRGRNGADQLALTMLAVSLVIQLVSSFTGVGIVYIVSMVLYILTLWRVFSRKSYKREAENAKFMTFVTTILTRIRQFFTRLRHSNEYKYFKCPKCRTRLRLTRGQGEKDITCPKCGHLFRIKA